ncbi:MAG: TatD family hydrolase, partial [Chloroflexi bacterium]|nr:TatD family hydrolase [Chloroflexota bacterium]
MPMVLCDCHVHLASYEAQESYDVIRRAEGANVKTIITAGTTLETSRRCIELASSFTSVYAGVGIHPNRVRGFLKDSELEALERLA